MTDDTRWAESMPEVYDRCLGPAVFAPYAAHLAALAQGPRVLELAAGSGVVTRALVAKGLAVTATDLNQAMVDHGRAQVPEATWETADAMSLPFPDGSFDEVVVSFGVMFLPDKGAAFAEMLRVLVPGGRVLVSVWDTIDGLFFERELLEELLPLQPQADFLRRTPHGYADPDRIRADAQAGGLEVVALDRVVLQGTSTAAEIAEGYCLGTPTRFDLDDPAAMASTMTERLTARWGSGPVTGDLTGWVLQARRPDPVTYERYEHATGPFFHGTRFDLSVGDELVAGRGSNFQEGRVSNNIYFSANLESAVWGAELATALAGVTERGRVYVVEPTGPFEDDPNLTNARFPGNPTRSYRSRHPLRVVGEVTDWEGHPPEVLQGMLDSLARLRAEGRDVILD